MDRHGEELAETFVKMINTHDPDVVDQFEAEGYVNHEALFSAVGREANRQFWHTFFAALPDVSASMEDLVISGDRVVGRFVYRGTHTGDFMGIPASGNAVEMRSIDIWRVEDGVFAEHWDEVNALQVFQQMGALPPLGGSSGSRRDAAVPACRARHDRGHWRGLRHRRLLRARPAAGAHQGLTTPPSPQSWEGCTASPTAGCPLRESSVSPQPRLAVRIRLGRRGHPCRSQ